MLVKQSGGERWTVAWKLAIFSALYLAVRLPGLMAMPVYCDESIYLRYAQLIHRSPLAKAFVSLVDPKPPLHYWLLASVFGLTADPLLAGRLVSVAAGLLSLWVLPPICRELARLGGDGTSEPPPSFTTGACWLFLFCPFLAFYQRMALAEALLVLETLLVAWLSLRWARHARRRTLPELLWKDALPLGLALAAAILTKQITSYVLFGLPLAAAIVFAGERTEDRPVGRIAASFLFAAALAVLLFLPYLLLPGPPLLLRIFFHESHGSFEGGAALHARLAWDNFRYAFVPMILKEIFPVRLEGFRAPADAGWFWIYLTPPVYLLSLAGFAWLAWRRRWRLLVFLGAWAFLMLLPFIPFAKMAVSRYVLAAVPPFLLAGAALLSDLARRAPVWRMSSSRAAAVLGLLLVWPFWSIVRQDFDWQRQPLTRADRWQYVSGWPAGGAARAAVEVLKGLVSRDHPALVITHGFPGTPTDVAWVSLDGRPGFSLFFAPWALSSPILRPAPGSPGRFLLMSAFHDSHSLKEVVLPGPDTSIFFVSDDPYPSDDGGTVRADALLTPRNPGIRQVARFSNPPMGLPHVADGVAIYRLR